jgi:hypothetical protein
MADLLDAQSAPPLMAGSKKIIQNARGDLDMSEDEKTVDWEGGVPAEPSIASADEDEAAEGGASDRHAGGLPRKVEVMKKAGKKVAAKGKAPLKVAAMKVSGKKNDGQRRMDRKCIHSRAYHAARKVAEKSVDAGGLGMSVEESKKYAKDEAQKALAVAGVF